MADDMNIVLWLLPILSCGTCESLYDKRHQNLTSIPRNSIPQATTRLLLDYNQITAVQQADFNDLFTDLEIISLHDNFISAIELGCFTGTKLRQMYLGNNSIEKFPDFSAVSSTLEEVYLQLNSINSVNKDDLKELSQLKLLNLKFNPLEFISDHLLGLSNMETLNLRGTQLSCCADLVWLKDSRANITKLTCSSGTSLAGLAFDDLTREQLMADLCRE
jgi:Leucine-rich repeat (LRR) protein